MRKDLTERPKPIYFEFAEPDAAGITSGILSISATLRRSRLFDQKRMPTGLHRFLYDKSLVLPSPWTVTYGTRSDAEGNTSLILRPRVRVPPSVDFEVGSFSPRSSSGGRARDKVSLRRFAVSVPLLKLDRPVLAVDRTLSQRGFWIGRKRYGIRMSTSANRKNASNASRSFAVGRWIVMRSHATTRPPCLATSTKI